MTIVNVSVCVCVCVCECVCVWVCGCVFLTTFVFQIWFPPFEKSPSFKAPQLRNGII